MHSARPNGTRTTIAAGPRLPALLAYCAPALPLAALTLPVYIFVPSFYAQSLGVPIATVGAILLFTRILDAVTDPLIGTVSDRWSVRRGRRKPWLAAGCPVAVVSAWMLFVPPDGAGASHLLIWSLMLSLAWTAMLIPYSAWGAELTGDYDGRSRVTGLRESMTVVGTLLATAAPAVLAAVGHPGQPAALLGTAIFIVVILPLAVTAALRWTPDRPQVAARGLPFREGLIAIARNRAFVRLLCAFLVNSLANAFPATLFVFYVSRRLDAPDAVGPLLFAYFLCGVIGIPFWLALARRTAKHRAWITAMIAACAAFVWTPLLGPGDQALFWCVVVLSGLCLGADLALPPSMQADVIDHDTLATGEQRTATYFALWSLATKLALALAVGIAFPVLGLAGFDASEAGSGDGVIALALLYGGVPVALKMVAIQIMRGYPLTREVQQALERKLAGTGYSP